MSDRATDQSIRASAKERTAPADETLLRAGRRSARGPRPFARRGGGPAVLVGSPLTIQGRAPVPALCGLTLALSTLVFPPVGWSWLGWVVLVPWLVCVCSARRSRWVYGCSYLMGVAFFAINVRWMFAVTPPGFVALCLYFGAFFPLAAWPTRHLFRRRGISAALAAPIAWVAAEYLRSITPVGFPWLLLAHSQYTHLTVIQISDLVGAFGVSFVLAMVNGWIADLLVQPLFIWRHERPQRATRLPLGSLTTLGVVAGTLIYGGMQGSRHHLRPGPKVAIVQNDFELYVDRERAERTQPDILARSSLVLAKLAAVEKPDLIVLPETAAGWPLNDEFIHASPAVLTEIHRRRFPMWPDGAIETMAMEGRSTREAFQKLCDESNASLVLGSQAYEWFPKDIPPRVEAYNAALLLTPGLDRTAARYDKIHLVLFGEYVPFRQSYHALYEWLNARTPWGREGVEYSLSPGSVFEVFEFRSATRGGRTFRAGTPICYEEIMPYVPREFTLGPPTGDSNTPSKRIDMLLTISNDGWFHHSAELEQHLAAAVFRAVENRIAVARSVNTGASALIDPNGKIHHRVELPDEKRPALDRLAAALRELLPMARAIEENAGLGPERRVEAFQRALVQVQGGVRAASAQLGPEFAFIDERLTYLVDRALSAPPRYSVEAAWQLRSQVEDDLAAVARWRVKPWTAPGIRVGELRCDARLTIYTRWGDWFARAATGLMALALVDWLIRRRRRRRTRQAAASAGA